MEDHEPHSYFPMSISFTAVTVTGQLVDPPEIFTFPGGEHHLRAPQTPYPDEPINWTVMVRGADPNDLIKAALLADYAFRERGERISLLLPYLPAARADRGVPLGARVYSTFVNAIYAKVVVGLDPHSQIIVSMIPELRLADPVPLIQRALTDSKLTYDAVIAPDAGAIDRATDAAEALGIDLYQAEKHRDFDSGAITGIEIKELPTSGKYLVVDDICDGGGTFRGLAAATGLHRDRLGLWVTHGIFSGKAGDLRNDYTEILTTDSHPGHNRIGVATTIVPVLVELLTQTREVVA